MRERVGKAADWRRLDVPADMPDADAIAALRRHPRFAEAAERQAQGVAEQYRGNPIMNRVLNDRGRFMLGVLVLDLHYGGPPGLTLARLREECASTGLCSPGRATAAVGVMRLFGLLTGAPSSDRRVRLLVPTPRMLALHRERQRRVYSAMAAVLPEGEEGLARLEDPGFVVAVTRAWVRRYRAGHRLLPQTPTLARIGERDAGIVIAFALLAAGYRDGFGLPLDLSITDLARRFGVSRAHVLTVLREAADDGLVSHAGGRPGIVLSPLFRETMEELVARVFLLQAAILHEARDSVQSGSGAVD